MGDPRGTSDHGRNDAHGDRSLGPVHSALGLRLGLAVFGLLVSIGGLVVAVLTTRSLAWLVLFAVLIAVAALNIVVVAVRLLHRRRRRAARREEV